jgi:hypothetical protein
MAEFPRDGLICGLRQCLEDVVDLLVEAIHIQLSYEAMPIRVLEVLAEEKPERAAMLVIVHLCNSVHTSQIRWDPSR